LVGACGLYATVHCAILHCNTWVQFVQKAWAKGAQAPLLTEVFDPPNT